MCILALSLSLVCKLLKQSVQGFTKEFSQHWMQTWTSSSWERFPVVSCSGQEAIMALWENSSISAECPHLDAFHNKTPRVAVNVRYLSKCHVLVSRLKELRQLLSSHTHYAHLPSRHYSLESFVDTHKKTSSFSFTRQAQTTFSTKC